ncbi:MAG: segregation/condensation protein A [Planctomycetales bacterium]|nr:segregation/condensation protein A [Planctomycetales bacterium]
MRQLLQSQGRFFDSAPSREATLDFRVQLDTYHGPLDLLLYLVRKEELQVARLPLARVTQQFLEFVAVLEELSVDEVSDYIELAAQLIELKSRTVLPQHEDLPQPEVEDPHEGLVERLLEYRKYREAAQLLAERDAQHRLRFARAVRDLPSRSVDPLDQPMESVELWDLVSAFARVLKQNLARPAVTRIRYDETPVHVYMQQISQRLQAEREVRFSSLFPASVHKSTLVAMFLAVLELVRHRHATVDQSERYGDLLIKPGARPYPVRSGSASGATEPGP